MMSTAKVSVQVPVYNAEKFIVASLSSILAENDTALEVIALDDGSTDQTPDLLRELAASDSRLRVERNTRNLGEAGSRQRMVEMTDAEFIMPFDADDIYLAGRLDRQRRYLEDHPAYSAIYGKTLAWNMADDGLAYYSGRPFSNFMIFSGNPLGHGSIMFRRSALLAAGGYLEPFQGAESLPVSCDFFMWLRLAQVGPLKFDNSFAYLYRMHGEQSAQTKTPLFAKAHRFIADWFKEKNGDLLQRLLRQEPLNCTPEQLPLLMQSLGFLTVAVRGAGGDPLPFINCAAQIEPEDYGPATAAYEYWRKKNDVSQALAAVETMLSRFASEPFVAMGALKMKLEILRTSDGNASALAACRKELSRIEPLCLGTPEEYRSIRTYAEKFINP